MVLRRYVRNLVLSQKRRFCIQDSAIPAWCKRFGAVTCMKCVDQQVKLWVVFFMFRTMVAQVRKCIATSLSVTNFTPPFLEFYPSLSKKTPMGWCYFMPMCKERLYMRSAARRQQYSEFSESWEKSISCPFSLFFWERHLTWICWI